MRFSEGSNRGLVDVVGNSKGKASLYCDPETRAICRIPTFRAKAYRIVEAATVAKYAADG